MKKESEFCTCIVKSLNESGNLGYKIPDPSGDFSATIKRCFDIIGRIGDKPLYLEAKFDKAAGAFSLKRIEQHQATYLDDFGKVKDAITYIAYGAHWGRGDTRAYIFKWEDIKELYEKGFSFHKKYLDKLPFNAVKKNLFSFDHIIDKKMICEVYGGNVYESEV